MLAFSGGWPGDLILDGPGTALHLHLMMEHLRDGGGAYWSPELWSGTPTSALAPSLPVLSLVPLGLWLGAETAVKAATLAFQVLGGWGAFILARSFWNGSVVPFVAGVLYALAPIMISHGALGGQEPLIAMMAAVPWVAWSVRKAFSEIGSWRHTMVAGLLVAFAVLQQPEHAYGLALLCGLQFAVELVKACRDPERSPVAIIKRATVIVLAATGLIAFWLLPMLALRDWFIFTPSEMARMGLAGSPLVHHPLIFLVPTKGLRGAVSFTGDIWRGSFYLSLACLIPATVTIVSLSRHDEDGHVSAIGVAGSVSLWLSTVGSRIPEAGPMRGWHVLAALGLASVTGLLVTKMLRHLASARVALASGIASGLLLVAAPFATPFSALQRIVPLLGTMRFPRFYPIAVLGISLGAAYAIVFVGRWVVTRKPELERAATPIVGLALLVGFVVDLAPYRNFYRLQRTPDRGAYDTAAGLLDSAPEGSRVAPRQWPDPRPSHSLVALGHELSVGWPHPIAGRHVWRLTAEALDAPSIYRQRALGLSSTAFVTSEELVRMGSETEQVQAVLAERNPYLMPRVRAYKDVVIVEDEAIAPELAVSLAHRQVAVVTGGSTARQELDALSPIVLDGDALCTGDRNPHPALAGEVGMACSLHPWIGVQGMRFSAAIRNDVGGEFRSFVPGLMGLALWLDRPPGDAEMVVWELGPSGKREAEVRRARSWDMDQTGLYAFHFDPLEQSAGKHYAFALSCRGCRVEDVPRLQGTRDPRGQGTFTEAGILDSDRAVGFSLIYPQFPQGRSSDLSVISNRRRSGRWDLHVRGSTPALVVVADTYFPGWQATVDGHVTPVVRADGAFVGVVVPAGEHRVVLFYRPTPYTMAGRTVTAMTLVALGVAGVRSQRRAPRHAGRSKNADLVGPR